MLDIILDIISVLRESPWIVIAVVALILIPALRFLVRALHSSSRMSDLTRDELRLLKAFNEQAKDNPRAYLSVEFAAYKAEVNNYEVKLQRLKALGYLQDSHIKSGYLGHRPVRITAKGIRRVEKRR